MDQTLPLTSSAPSLTEFDPTLIPFQHRVLTDLENFDHSNGVFEILLSGSIGSAKTILMAHIAVINCLRYPKNIGLIGRRTMPDLKDTILKKVLDHVDGVLKEGIHYQHNKSSSKIEFFNGSEILCRSWADKSYTKVRSLDLGFAIIEEVTENTSEEFQEVYKEIFARIGRLRHVKKNFIICATNPGSPAHFAYDYFISSNIPTRKVYYSLTEQNPFLPKTYITNLKNTFSPQEARRMLYGEWIEIRSEFIYYNFSEQKNVIDDYKINLRYPIYISYDFNIGEGKPMSCCLYQRINEKFYFFAEVVITGSNTRETCDEMIARGILDIPTKFIIHGDAAGRSKSSKYNKSDYDIIEQIFSAYQTKLGNRVNFEVDVPLSNPPVRKRHIVMNGQFENANGEVNLFVARECKTLIKGFRLTKLKQGGKYIEDDSDSWQHITTAAGYGVLRDIDNEDSQENLSIGSIYGHKIK